MQVVIMSRKNIRFQHFMCNCVKITNFNSLSRAIQTVFLEVYLIIFTWQELVTRSYWA